VHNLGKLLADCTNVAYNVSINSLTKQLSLRWVRQWRKWCALLATVEEEGSSGMLSDQSEILLELFVV